MKGTRRKLQDPVSQFMGAGDNRMNRLAYRRLLLQMMKDLLTRRQLECLKGYYIDGETQAQIAQRLQISASCVCKHLKAGRQRLTQTADYLLELLRLHAGDQA